MINQSAALGSGPPGARQDVSADAVIHATLSRAPSGAHLAIDRQRVLRAEGSSPSEAAIGLVRAVLAAEGATEISFSIHISRVAPGTVQVSSVLADLHARATAAACVVNLLEPSSADQLSEHVDAITHHLGGLLGEPPPNDDVTDVLDHEESHALEEALDDLRRLVRKADALASTTDEQFSRVVVIREGDDGPGLNRLAHLVGLTAAVAEDAMEASARLIAIVERALPAKRA